MLTIFKSITNSFRLFFNSKRLGAFSNYIPARIQFTGNNLFLKGAKIFGNVVIGDGCKIYKSFLSGNISIGANTSISGPLTSIISSGKGQIKIGSYCSIARGVQIQEYNHIYNRASSYFFGQNIFKKSIDIDIESKGDIIVEEDVWIGTNSIILSGVKIGRGAIIAAGSVVNRDVASYSIVGGVPAKFIKNRFSQETIMDLESSRWWQWTKETILKNEDFFMKFRG